MNPAEMPVPNAPRNTPNVAGQTRLKNGFSIAGLVLTAFSFIGTPFVQGQTSYTFSTLAGIGGKPGYLNGSGGGIDFPLFSAPSGIVLNKDGNFFVTDSSNELIRIVTPSGTVTTFAGTVGQTGSQDGTGISAGFFSPQGPALDSAGNLYVADYSGAIIRKITPAGVVTTIAGLASTVGSTDGTGSAALFFRPTGLAVDGSGSIYVADSGNNTIRKITNAGVVTTVAGLAGTFGHTDTDTTAGIAGLFYNPTAVAIDASGTIYVADTNNNTIRKISSTGVVTTFAGVAETYGGTDGNGTAARFNGPSALVFDSSGNLYVADELNHAIRKITPNGDVTTVAGLAGTPGIVDGSAGAARFNHPSGLTFDGAGNLYVADYGNSLIRKISSTGVVTTVAGVSGIAGALDGQGYNLTPALLSNPSGTTVGAGGNVYVADTANNLIRQITPAGVVSTFAGNINLIDSRDGTGSSAGFFSPNGLTSDASGNLYVADTASQLIRKITTTGVVTTIAGTLATPGNADGNGTAATFNFPSSVAVDAAGSVVYVADYNNHVIRKIVTATGDVTTFAGTAGIAGSADGQGATARFNFPRGVAIDSGGYVYVADSGNDVIRRISPSGQVQTLAGSAGAAGSSDGSGSAARFDGPSGIAVDAAFNVYVADTNNSTIRLITSAGVVSTIGGVAGSTSNVDGVGTAARFNHPAGLSIDASGNLYIADSRNHTIRIGFTATSGGSGGTTGGGTTGGTGGAGGTGGTGGGNGGTGGTGGTTGTGTGFLMHPGGIALNIVGGLYVADTSNNSIKSVAPDYTVTVLAGKDGTAGSANGTGTAATFNSPTGMVTDGVGNIFLCDTGNGTIREITSTGVVTTLAGSSSVRGSQDGTGNAAQFSSPTGIAMDSLGNLYVSDSGNSTIRKITSAGVVTTFAGTAKSVGDADGLGTAARFNNPTGMIINPSTNFLYIADTNNDTIRAINTADITTSTVVTNADGTTTTTTTVLAPAGTVTTIAGSPGISGSFDGTGSFALFNLPQGLSTDGSSIYVADTGNNCVRRIAGNNAVTTVAGIAGIAGNRDGTNTTALFNQPQALVYNSIIFVADTGNSILRTISGQLVVTTAGLKSPTTTTTTGSGTTTGSTSSGYGGGSTEPWFVILLAMSGSILMIKRRQLKTSVKV
ncbi:MAG TPA: hypothetical protein VGM64_17075 [Lacunisphaera sp.]|jgi:DNA-binding beta-propeller fold protein YncE